MLLDRGNRRAHQEWTIRRYRQIWAQDTERRQLKQSPNEPKYTTQIKKKEQYGPYQNYRELAYVFYEG